MRVLRMHTARVTVSVRIRVSVRKLYGLLHGWPYAHTTPLSHTGTPVAVCIASFPITSFCCVLVYQQKWQVIKHINFTHRWTETLSRVIYCCIPLRNVSCEKTPSKQAIKEAAANSDRAFNDGLFDELCKKDNVGFWKTWRKKFCSHSLKLSPRLW